MVQTNPLIKFLIKTASRPGKIAEPLSISITYSCWRPTVIISFLCCMSILKKKI